MSEIRAVGAPSSLTSIVAGQEVTGSGPAFDSSDPWTDAVVASAVQAGPEIVAAAAAAAAAALEPFARMSWTARAAILERASDIVGRRQEELADMMVREVGKPVNEARAEAARVRAVLNFYAQEGRRAKGEIIPADEPGVAILTRRRPAGVTLAITPWNFPLAIPAWKIAPALLSGCPVIWKPASAAIACADLLTRCLLEAGLPEGALSLVLGGGSTGNLLLDQDLAAVTFTGSTDVGYHIRDRVTPRGTRVQLELGGKNMAIVLDDADPACAEAIARASYGYAGQKCTATSVVVAEAGIRAELEDRLATLTRSIPWGDPADPSVWGGPVIDHGQRDAINAMVDESVGQGAEVIAQGTAEAHGTLVQPTLVRSSNQDVTVARTEVFGPVLTTLSDFDGRSLAEVANNTAFGLAASVYGKDLDRVRTLCNQLKVGTVAINRMSTGLEVQAPSGGWKASGFGDAEQGTDAIRFFTKSQTIYWKSGAEDSEFP